MIISHSPTNRPIQILPLSFFLSPRLSFLPSFSTMEDATFSKLSDDIVLKIFFNLEDDPRNWARLSCVCKKFSSLISTICCETKCLSTIPSISSDDLLSLAATPPGGWSSLLKIAVCCPGLLHAGVLLDNSDFGLSRELGPDYNYRPIACSSASPQNNCLLEKDENHNYNNNLLIPQKQSLNRSDYTHPYSQSIASLSSPLQSNNYNNNSLISQKHDKKSLEYTQPCPYSDMQPAASPSTPPQSNCVLEDENRNCNTSLVPQNQGSGRLEDTRSYSCCGSDYWSLYDDLYFDTIYDNSESQVDLSSNPNPNPQLGFEGLGDSESKNKKRKKVVGRQQRAHLASGGWNLSREQGNKLLASRFRGDCLYICDWPGCVHIEEKRNYMLFRGFFKNFKRSRVWRTINDGNRSRIDLNCAFCSCKETWDLHSAFCLKRGFGFHDDGDPVVRAYVCEHGHVSGAWTDLPLYT